MTAFAAFVFVVAAVFFLAGLVLFCLAVVYYGRAREAYAHTDAMQQEALAAQRDALDLAALAREYVL